jgi:hypothetical protein
MQAADKANVSFFIGDLQLGGDHAWLPVVTVDLNVSAETGFSCAA